MGYIFASGIFLTWRFSFFLGYWGFFVLASSFLWADALSVPSLFQSHQGIFEKQLEDTLQDSQTKLVRSWQKQLSSRSHLLTAECDALFANKESFEKSLEIWLQEESNRERKLVVLGSKLLSLVDNDKSSEDIKKNIKCAVIMSFRYGAVDIACDSLLSNYYAKLIFKVMSLSDQETVWVYTDLCPVVLASESFLIKKNINFLYMFKFMLESLSLLDKDKFKDRFYLRFAMCHLLLEIGKTIPDFQDICLNIAEYRSVFFYDKDKGEVSGKFKQKIEELLAKLSPMVQDSSSPNSVIYNLLVGILQKENKFFSLEDSCTPNLKLKKPSKTSPLTFTKEEISAIQSCEENALQMYYVFTGFIEKEKINSKCLNPLLVLTRAGILLHLYLSEGQDFYLDMAEGDLRRILPVEDLSEDLKVALGYVEGVVSAEKEFKHDIYNVVGWSEKTKKKIDYARDSSKKEVFLKLVEPLGEPFRRFLEKGVCETAELLDKEIKSMELLLMAGDKNIDNLTGRTHLRRAKGLFWDKDLRKQVNKEGFQVHMTQWSSLPHHFQKQEAELLLYFANAYGPDVVVPYVCQMPNVDSWMADIVKNASFSGVCRQNWCEALGCYYQANPANIKNFVGFLRHLMQQDDNVGFPENFKLLSKDHPWVSCLERAIDWMQSDNDIKSDPFYADDVAALICQAIPYFPEKISDDWMSVVQQSHYKNMVYMSVKQHVMNPFYGMSEDLAVKLFKTMETWSLDLVKDMLISLESRAMLPNTQEWQLTQLSLSMQQQNHLNESWRMENWKTLLLKMAEKCLHENACPGTVWLVYKAASSCGLSLPDLPDKFLNSLSWDFLMNRDGSLFAVTLREYVRSKMADPQNDTVMKRLLQNIFRLDPDSFAMKEREMFLEMLQDVFSVQDGRFVVSDYPEGWPWFRQTKKSITPSYIRAQKTHFVDTDAAMHAILNMAKGADILGFYGVSAYAPEQILERFLADDSLTTDSKKTAFNTRFTGDVSAKESTNVALLSVASRYGATTLWSAKNAGEFLQKKDIQTYPLLAALVAEEAYNREESKKKDAFFKQYSHLMTISFRTQILLKKGALSDALSLKDQNPVVLEKVNTLQEAKSAYCDKKTDGVSALLEKLDLEWALELDASYVWLRRAELLLLLDRDADFVELVAAHGQKDLDDSMLQTYLLKAFSAKHLSCEAFIDLIDNRWGDKIPDNLVRLYLETLWDSGDTDTLREKLRKQKVKTFLLDTNLWNTQEHRTLLLDILQSLKEDLSKEYSDYFVKVAKDFSVLVSVDVQEAENVFENCLWPYFYKKEDWNSLQTLVGFFPESFVTWREFLELKRLFLNKQFELFVEKDKNNVPGLEKEREILGMWKRMREMLSQFPLTDDDELELLALSESLDKTYWPKDAISKLELLKKRWDVAKVDKQLQEWIDGKTAKRKGLSLVVVEKIEKVVSNLTQKTPHKADDLLKKCHTLKYILLRDELLGEHKTIEQCWKNKTLRASFDKKYQRASELFVVIGSPAKHQIDADLSNHAGQLKALDDRLDLLEEDYQKLRNITIAKDDGREAILLAAVDHVAEPLQGDLSQKYGEPEDLKEKKALVKRVVSDVISQSIACKPLPLSFKECFDKAKGILSDVLKRECEYVLHQNDFLQMEDAEAAKKNMTEWWARYPDKDAETQRCLNDHKGSSEIKRKLFGFFKENLLLKEKDAVKKARIYRWLLFLGTHGKNVKKFYEELLKLEPQSASLLLAYGEYALTQRESFDDDDLKCVLGKIDIEVNYPRLQESALILQLKKLRDDLMTALPARNVLPPSFVDGRTYGQVLQDNKPSFAKPTLPLLSSSPLTPPLLQESLPGEGDRDSEKEKEEIVAGTGVMLDTGMEAYSPEQQGLPSVSLQVLPPVVLSQDALNNNMVAEERWKACGSDVERIIVLRARSIERHRDPHALLRWFGELSWDHFSGVHNHLNFCEDSADFLFLRWLSMTEAVGRGYLMASDEQQFESRIETLQNYLLHLLHKNRRFALEEQGLKPALGNNTILYMVMKILDTRKQLEAGGTFFFSYKKMDELVLILLREILQHPQRCHPNLLKQFRELLGSLRATSMGRYDHLVAMEAYGMALSGQVDKGLELLRQMMFHYSRIQGYFMFGHDYMSIHKVYLSNLLAQPLGVVVFEHEKNKMVHDLAAVADEAKHNMANVKSRSEQEAAYEDYAGARLSAALFHCFWSDRGMCEALLLSLDTEWRTETDVERRQRKKALYEQIVAVAGNYGMIAYSWVLPPMLPIRYVSFGSANSLLQQAA